MVDNHTGDEQSVDHGLDPDRLVSRRSYLTLAGVSVAGALLATQVAEAAPTGYPYAIVIDGRDTTEPSQYSFTVADGILAVDALNVDSGTISGTSVEGTVDGSVAAYWFQTQITDFTVSGPASVSFGENADQPIPEGANTLVITSPTDVMYEFVANGEVRKRLDDGDLAAEDGNDVVVQNGDGTWTASGRTGNGYGDSYDIDGAVTEFTVSGDDYSLRLNGQSVTPGALTGDHTDDGGSSGDGRSTDDLAWDQLIITTPTDLQYEFETDGEVRKLLDNGDLSAEEGNDIVEENADGSWSVAGRTGNGYGDTYELAGSVTDFTPMTGDFSLQLDGSVVSPEELVGETDSKSDGDQPTTNGLIGGGDGYPAAVDPSQADYSVGSLSELRGALADASSGDIVYLTDDVEASSGIDVPDGVTLASDRGIDGASGSTISTADEIILLEVGDDARITGLRIDGPMSDYESWDGYPAGTGIECGGSGIEIDNCEVFGFAFASVEASNDEHVHHCHIHHNPQDGLGYGVTCTGGHPTIEYCRFNYNRHSIAGSGSGGYNVRYNYFGSDTVDHVIDMHSPGGTTLNIHHNTVEATDHVQDSGETEAVYIRGRPSDGANIHHNWFYHQDAPSSGGGPGEAVRTGFDSWSEANVELSNNAYGTSEPGEEIGAPR